MRAKFYGKAFCVVKRRARRTLARTRLGTVTMWMEVGRQVDGGGRTASRAEGLNEGWWGYAFAGLWTEAGMVWVQVVQAVGVGGIKASSASGGYELKDFAEYT